MEKESKRIAPLWSKISLIILLLSIIIYIFAINNANFADFINQTVSSKIREILAMISNIFPFSFFEMLIILLPLILVLLIIYTVKKARNLRSALSVIFSLIGVISLFLTSYIFTLGVGYRTTELSDRIGISDSPDIPTEELYKVTLLVRDEVNRYADTLTQSDGQSIMPYSADELNDKLMRAYSTMNDEYSIVSCFDSRVKPVYFSTVMSDLRITGIYSFFTGEANVNVEYPDYNLPFTAAHELAHQRGISRENEANFVAFLVTVSSDDDFIRYSGYLNMYEYLASALYRADKELYYDVVEGLCDEAKADIRASAAVYEAHKDSFLGELNEKLNDRYLQANGTEGNVTYGYVVRLAVGYYKK